MATSRSIILKQFFDELTKKGDASLPFLNSLKRRFAAKFKIQFPKNRELLSFYHGRIKNKSKSEKIEKLLQTRAVRSLSGVAVITVLTKPYPCPGRCLFCPNEPDMPKSYLKSEPAANRAFLTKFDPFAQVKVRLDALRDNGHPTDKIELIVLGGTWSAYPKNYQYWFIKECFRAANSFRHNPPTPLSEGGQSRPASLLKEGSGELNKIIRQLKKEQRQNETARNRIVGLTLETRPDSIDVEEIKKMRDLGATRVELGAQSIYNDVLAKNLRNHSAAQIAQATKLLKNAGFKINYHMMLNLPEANPRRDFEMFKEIFSNPDFQPDLLKIYPCAVLKTAPLYRLWKKGEYRPYGEKQLAALILKIKKIIPPYVRIQRIIRDIPGQEIMAGSRISNLRQLIEKRKECRCIRCREVRGEYSFKDKIKLFRQDYEASGGKEIFLSFESPDKKKLYALLRLRIPNGRLPALPDGRQVGQLENCALVRELHTYGSLAPLKINSKKYAQHQGLGKKLMAEAEKIVKKETVFPRIAVIAGVGVRRYYKKLGYRLKDEYMVKGIKRRK